MTSPRRRFGFLEIPPFEGSSKSSLSGAERLFELAACLSREDRKVKIPTGIQTPLKRIEHDFTHCESVPDHLPVHELVADSPCYMSLRRR